jgi:hypothetical protein
MSRLKGAVFDRAVANAMGLNSVHNCEKWGEHMTEEDEEFQRIEREAEMRRMAEEDDDIQVYKKPWVNLTVDELIDLEHKHLSHENLVRAIEAKLKEKNA